MLPTTSCGKTPLLSSKCTNRNLLYKSMVPVNLFKLKSRLFHSLDLECASPLQSPFWVDLYSNPLPSSPLPDPALSTYPTNAHE
ncbi:hypothetical protein CEXT_637031 [Caerostris extrusa]|uniref:Uncharacterized protein n=1 Tax=Caerostris extrusa TaxID=172846 RepID=A0AAV4TDD8_CAEEX|nr:hypothetical protein CEXT_637031 [Caerostris extrusa]